jgi:hypothetical protein
MKRLLLFMSTAILLRIALAQAPTKIEVHGSSWTGMPRPLMSVARLPVPCPNPAELGDTMFEIGTYGSAANRIGTITDNLGTNTWHIDQNVHDVRNQQSLFIGRSSNVGSGTRVPETRFSASLQYTGGVCLLLNNLAPSEVLDGNGCSTSTYQGTNPTCWLTTTSDGDEVICAAMARKMDMPSTAVRLNSRSLTLVDVDGFIPMAAGIVHQSHHGALSPSFHSGSPGTWLMACQAYRTAFAGGREPSTAYVKQMQEVNFVTNQSLKGTSFNLPFPALAKVNTIDIAAQSNNCVTITKVASSPTCNWGHTRVERIGPSCDGVSVQHWYATHCPAKNGMTLRFSLTSTPDPGTPLRAFTAAIAGIANAGDPDMYCGSTGNFLAPHGTIAKVLGSGCTTSEPDEVLTWLHQEYQQTVTSASSSGGRSYSLMGDFGVCANESSQQDEGLGTVYTAAPGNYNVNVTYPNPPYCGSSTLNVGLWAAQGIAWKSANQRGGR